MFELYELIMRKKARQFWVYHMPSNPLKPSSEMLQFHPVQAQSLQDFQIPGLRGRRQGQERKWRAEQINRSSRKARKIAR